MENVDVAPSSNKGTTEIFSCRSELVASFLLSKISCYLLFMPFFISNIYLPALDLICKNVLLKRLRDPRTLSHQSSGDIRQ